MCNESFVLAHIMGVPVEETVLFGLPPLAAAIGTWWTRHRAERAARTEDKTESDVPSPKLAERP